MSRFYGTVQGNRGITSRCGHATSGIAVSGDGWHSGVDVSGYVDDDGRDVFVVTATRGSSGASDVGRIATITYDQGEIQVELNRHIQGKHA